jgi:hypothetical protein
MEFHMINITYATKHTARWTYSAKDFEIPLCHTPPLRSFFIHSLAPGEIASKMLRTREACTAAQVPFPRTPSSSGSEPSPQGMMFRPAVLLGLAGRLDLSGLLILAGTSWQLMQHVAYIHHKCGIFKFQISNFKF